MSFKSDFDWRHVEIFKDNRATTVIEIVDLDLGNMSVTNDIENVVTQIATELPEDNPITENAIIYRDSEGIWDEVVLDKAGNFAQFAALPRGRCLTELQSEAVLRLVKRQLGLESGS